MDEEKKLDNSAGGVNISGGQTHVYGDLVAGNKIVYEAPAPIITALHQIAEPVADFVGREVEIAMLERAIRGGGRVAIGGITGMGGIDKTQLALLVAQRVRDDYPDAQLFVDLRGTDQTPLNPADALGSCIRALVGSDAQLPN